MRAAGEAIFSRLVPLVTGWCIRLGAGGIDAEAAASDALLVILRRLDDIEAGAPVEAFAWGVTTRVVREHRRRAWWRRWVPGVAVEGVSTKDDDDPEKRERRRLVHAVLASLSDDHREVVVLMDLEERAAPEVARLLGIPEGTVRSRLRLARQAFRVAAEGLGLDAQTIQVEVFDA